MIDRLETCAELRRAGKNLQYIGELFGITRERVRQLLKPMGPLKPVPPPPPQKPPTPIMMKQWLWAEGYRKCEGECKQWMLWTKTLTDRRCHPCNAKYSRKRYHQDPAKAKSYVDPVKFREYQRKYDREHKGDRQVAQRERYKRNIATPEGRSKLAAKRRQYYQRLKETPEGREKLAAYSKRQCAAKKAKREAK